MLKKKLLSALLAVSSMQLCHAMEVPRIRSIDDIPNLCTYYVHFLVAQPLCNVFYRSEARRARVEVFPEKNDYEIVTLLHLNVQKICDEWWGISFFGEEDRCWAFNQYGSTGQDFGTGMLLLKEKIDLEKLHALYVKLINDVKQGWRISTIQDNPDIAIKKPERQWVLYIKKQSINRETELINFLIHKFSLDEKAQCSNNWVSELGAIETSGDLYLWIEKGVFRQFEARFKLGFQPLENGDDYITAE
jgi:hypothetical protein